MNLTSDVIYNEAIAFRQAIDNAKFNFDSNDRMRRFPHGCCDDATDLFAYHLYRKYGLLTTRVDGTYYADNPEDNDWHVWLEVERIIVDLTSDQYLEYADIFVGTSDSFHDRYDQRRLKYKRFYDLAEGCWNRMQYLYNQIVVNL